MPSLSDLDPDVLALYMGIKNGDFEDCDDFLASNPVDFYNKKHTEIKKVNKLPDRKVWVDGIEASDFVGDNDYGL